MNVKILNSNEKRAEMLIEDIDFALANALRRIMLSEIPVLAVEHVDFVDNTSGLYDEIVAHRLGLVPLTFSDKMNMKSECKCNGKGCSNCQVELSLDKEGPCIVKASDIVSSSKDVKPADMNIPIVELLDGQRLKLEAIAELGIGKDHAKWQTAVVGYKNIPVVKAKGDKSDLAPALKVCPCGVFAKKGESIGVAKTSNCDLCLRCTEVSDAVSVTPDPSKFLFVIESTCGLSAADIFNRALDVLESKAKEFSKAVKSEV